MSDWISVDDRFPGLREYVLVLEDDHENPQDFFWGTINRKNYYKPQRVRPAQLRFVDSEGNAVWQLCQLADGYPFDQPKNVTHWMALPEVPKQLVKPRPE